MTRRRAHWVRPNETTRLPRRHIVLDTEAQRRIGPAGEVQRWRLACATFWHAHAGRSRTETSGRYVDARELWQAVSDFTRPRHRTVLWAHNLGYDVRIAAAFTHLPALGWELVDANLASRGCWVRWRRDGASLVMVDSTAVFPCSLAELAGDLGMTKPDLPADTDSEADWWRRCEADVAILTAAVTEYLGWIERCDLGNWQMTGAGQSWAAWRHRFYTDRVLAHDDNTALAAERRAMWAGRCEVWRHGRVAGEGVAEYDLTCAYARIAEVADLPVRLIGPQPSMTLDRFDYLTRRYAVLADVTVTTEVPTVPAYVDGRIVWPVGTFTTTLWDVEVNLARDNGATVTVDRAWIYQAAPALSAWAEWVLRESNPVTTSLSPLCRRVAKHWSRALIGRFAMRYRSWSPFATSAEADLASFGGVDPATGDATQWLQVGKTVLVRDGYVDGDSAAPQITGYVQAIARCRLWQTMTAVGLDRVLYVDTDSVLVEACDAPAAEAFAAKHPTWALRRKGFWTSAELIAPRQLILGGAPRIAGIPRSSARLGERTYAGEVWQSVEVALRNGAADQVMIAPRRWTVKGSDLRRVHLAGGVTAARRVDALDRGHNERHAV